MALSAGSLREKIQIQIPVRTPNGSGGYETTYEDFLNTYAAVTEINPSADVIASQQDLKTLVQFKIRYRPENIKIGYRIIWRDFIFTVASSMKVDHLRTTITITAASEIETSERTHEATT